MKDFLSMHSNQTVAERPFSSDKKKREEKTFSLILGKQWSELQDSLIVFLQQNKLVVPYLLITLLMRALRTATLYRCDLKFDP